MTYRRIWTNGSGSLLGTAMRAENVKPSTGSGRYLEIGEGDMVAIPITEGSKSTVARYNPSELRVKNNRPSTFGRQFLITFNPEIGRAPMIVEGTDGGNIFEGIAPITATQMGTNRWVIRVYEIDTTTVM